jgi:hypothetical protein
MTATQLRTALSAKKKPAAADLQALMEEEVARGKLYRWDPARGKTPRYWTQSPETIAREALLESFGNADEPLTVAEYQKLSKIDAPATLVAKLLEQLVAEGRCHRYEPLKKDLARYWAGDRDRYARRIILGVLKKGKGKNAGPLSWPELAKALQVPLKGTSEDQLSQILQDLLDKGQAFKAFRFAANKPESYSDRPPDLVASVRESFGDIYKKFAKAGVSADQVDRAARSFLGVIAPAKASDLASEVQKTFAELRREKYGHSGLVPIPEIRRSIAARLGPDSARHDVLDDVIKGLVRDRKLNIIPLNDATGVSVEARNEGIPGSQETWFYLEACP